MLIPLPALKYRKTGGNGGDFSHPANDKYYVCLRLPQYKATGSGIMLSIEHAGALPVFTPFDYPCLVAGNAQQDQEEQT
jgi:hypothetical protein